MSDPMTESSRSIARFAAPCLLAALLLGAPMVSGPAIDSGALSAQDGVTSSGPEEIHPEALRAIGRLRSPYCPGLMLEVCPSPGADDLRDTLNVMAQSGMASDSLVEWALARYGEEWRAVPQTEGTGLLAWVMPPAVLILGIGLVVVALRRLRSDRPEGEDAPRISQEDERKLARALEDLEREGR